MKICMQAEYCTGKINCGKSVYFYRKVMGFTFFIQTIGRRDIFFSSVFQNTEAHDQFIGAKALNWYH